MDVIAYPGKTRLPQAEVRIAEADDGRLMWATSYHSMRWGFGYAPLPKWGNFASDRRSAIAAGFAELADQLDVRHDTVPEDVKRWVASMLAPAQGSLFA